VYIDNACYHITTRGNQKQAAFIDNEDYLRCLATVKRAKKKYAVLLYAYCLMPNHLHLLIESKIAGDISKFMHWVNRGYVAYFNAKYGKVGHLWQGRFKSKPIIKDRYLINCAEYIEENPVRAGLVSDIAAYPWSSYRERCLLSKKDMLDEIKVDGRFPAGQV